MQILGFVINKNVCIQTIFLYFYKYTTIKLCNI